MLFANANLRQAFSCRSRLVQSEPGFAENGRMNKPPIKEILARNIRAAMDSSNDLKTQKALASRAGISEAHLSDVLNQLVTAGVELVGQIAEALKLQPWELLADSETARQAAWARMLWGAGVSDKDVERHLPLPPEAPKKEAAPKRKKPGRESGGGQQGASQ